MIPEIYKIPEDLKRNMPEPKPIELLYYWGPNGAMAMFNPSKKTKEQVEQLIFRAVIYPVPKSFETYLLRYNLQEQSLNYDAEWYSAQNLDQVEACFPHIVDRLKRFLKIPKSVEISIEIIE